MYYIAGEMPVTSNRRVALERRSVQNLKLYGHWTHLVESIYNCCTADDLSGNQSHFDNSILVDGVQRTQPRRPIASLAAQLGNFTV